MPAVIRDSSERTLRIARTAGEDETVTFRICVVGAGWAGSRQIEAAAELGAAVEVAALVDSDVEHARGVADRFGIESVHAEYHSILSDDTIDAVSVCTPHDSHRDLAVSAAAAGKHVLCEKPLALSVQDGIEMNEMAERHGITLFVAENDCYTELARFLRNAVTDLVGDVLHVSVRSGFRNPDFAYAGRRSWLTQPERGGTDTWMLQGTHTIAQIRFAFGEIAEVFMSSHSGSSFRRTDIDASMTGTLVLEDGLAINFIQTSEIDFDDLRTYTIHGSHGSLKANSKGYRLIGTEEPEFVQFASNGMSPYAREIEAFIANVRKEAVGPTTGRSELRTLAVVQAGYDSAANRSVVSIGD
jgi:predicted dehydrogenase